MYSGDEDDFLDERVYEDELENQYQVGIDNMRHMALEGNAFGNDNNTSVDMMLFAIVKSLNEKQNIFIDSNDLNVIRKGLEIVPNPRFKNTGGFILGYYITSTNQVNQTIDKKRFNKIVKLLPDFIFTLLPPDVLRYCNLWISLIWPFL